MAQKLKLTIKPGLTARASVAFFILGQLSLTILLTGILLSFGFSKPAYAILLGNLTFIIPTGCFAFKFLAVSGAQAAGRIVRAFYKAEIIKLLLTVTLFAIILKFTSVDPAVFFISYIGSQLTFWLASLWLPFK